MHDRLGLAHGQPAQGVAVEADLEERLGGMLPELGVHAALDDAEQGLARVLLCGLAPSGPAQCPFQGFPRVIMGGRERDAFVKGHDDVRAQRFLDLHGILGADEMLRPAVEMGLERHALFGDLPEVRQAEDLEPSAVGQDRPMPAHELLHPAELPDQFLAGPQEQMVRVRKDDLGAQCDEVLRRKRLDRGLRAHGHEHRRADLAAGGEHLPQAGGGVGIFFYQRKAKRHLATN